MQTDAPIIEARDLSRNFGGINVVDGINLQVFPGEIVGLVGPDGAGKTTTLRLLSGLLDPSAGDARIAGCSIREDPAGVKGHIGYMAQRFGLYGDLTVDENMSFYADLFGIDGPERDAAAAELLKMTRMAPFRTRRAGRLSGGMKQKLALMCTLLHRPDVLLLDEPTNGVDPVSRRDFWAILYQLVRDGITVVVTTAYLDEAERCNRVALMHAGRIIRCASPEALRRQLDNELCYELHVAEPQQFRAPLERLPGVLSVEPAGAALHLFVSAGASEESLKAEFAKLLPASFRLQRIAPSLEDVFVRLIRAIDE